MLGNVGLSRFDRAVWAMIAGLLGAVLLLAWQGQRLQWAPKGSAGWRDWARRRSREESLDV
jgi:hypothetical protein